MTLLTDEQTIEDLGIFSKGSEGIYDIYNAADTRGGQAVLDTMFRHPLSNQKDINNRSSIIEHFSSRAIAFPFNASLFDMAEKYLSNSLEHPERKSGRSSIGDKEIQNGVTAIIEFIRIAKDFVTRKDITDINAYTQEREEIAALVEDPVFEPAFKAQPKGKISYAAITAYDALFRISEKNKVEKLLTLIYHLDVYMSVANIALRRNFAFPKALPKGSCKLCLKGVYHPSLKQPVGNEILITESQNVIFLTGANMAGKSTFLRSLSTALYVAHMGFPVAAQSMEFSVMDGIYTTVNLPDNLGIGASHFYAEVLRVKKMASALSSGKSFFILFDELFRGTNVKDAHQATVAIVNAFAGRQNSIFIISSHIVEAGDELKQKKNIGFFYLPTRMNGHVPEYTYTLAEGTTDDRHGMVIIRNERILDILKNGEKA